MVGSSVTFSTPAQQTIQQLMAAGQQIPRNLWGFGQDWSVYNAAHATSPPQAPAAGGGYGSSSAGPGTIDNAPALQYGQQIMQTAMDPQKALYDRTQQQLQEQIRAGLAARGINTSGVGAGIENKGMSDFNIDWQNQQLGRQVAGAGAYTGLAGLAQNIANQGFQNADLLGREEYRAPAAPTPQIMGAQPMPSYNAPSFDTGPAFGSAEWSQANFGNPSPTGWSQVGGDFWGPGTYGYNPNFQWS